MSAPSFVKAALADHPAGGEPQPLLVASLRRRVGAYAIDAVISWVVTLVALLVVLLIGAVFAGGSLHVGGQVSADSSNKELVNFAALSFVSVLVPFVMIGLLPALDGVWRGRTIGKRALDLQVIGIDGRAVTGGAVLRRACVFFGPWLVAVVVGPLLDAAAGTPPGFTFLLLGLDAAFLLVDLAIAPASGTTRRTIHDRAAGTVVVDCRTAPAHAPAVADVGDDAAEDAGPVTTPASGRAQTTGTWVGVWSLGSVLALSALVLLLISALGDHRSSTTSRAGDVPQVAATDRGNPPDSTATNDANPYPVNGSGAITASAPPYKASELFVDTGTSVRSAQRVAMRLGVAFMRCFERTKYDTKCATAGQLGLPSGVKVIEDDDIQYGDTTRVGQIVLTHGKVADAQRAIIGVYGPDGTLWGFGVSANFRVVAICDAPAGQDCSSTTEGHAFLGHVAIPKKVIALAER